MSARTAATGVLAAPAERVVMDSGEIRLLQGRLGLVIGVPHAGFEEFTEVMGERLARLAGVSAVIATGFAGARTGGVRLNVNRPTEGARLPPGAEPVTERARRVHQAYATLVRRAAGGPLALYVELHGNTRRASAGRLEVATAGIDARLARRLKETFRHARDRALAAEADLPAPDFWIEPVDPIHFRATSARRWPPFAEAAWVLHVELPHAARVPATARELYVGVLAELLEIAREAAGLSRD